MNRIISVALALWAGLAFAQAGSSRDARVSRGNLLRIPAYETPGTATQTYFVDGALGSNGTSCTASGAGACKTVQGALNKMPKLLRDQVTLTIAAGTYAGFVVSGFLGDESANSNPVGLLIVGTLANSTLATGTATGTCTGGTAGSGQTFATLVDSGQSWTVNDLTGRLLCPSNTGGNCFPIESNDATTITVVAVNGGAGFVTPVAATTTYAIEDSATIVNTAVALPGTPFLASLSSRASIIAIDNYGLGGRDGFVTFKNLQTAAATRGVVLGGNGSYALQQMQVRPTAAGFQAITSTVTGNNFGLGSCELTIQNSDIFLASPSTSSIVNWTLPSYVNLIGALIRGNSTSAAQFGLIAAGPVFLSTFETTGTTNGLWISGIGATAAGINGGRINCSTYTSSTAISVGNSTTVAGVQGVAAQTGANTIDHVQLNICATGLLVDGIASAELHGFTGGVGTNLVDARNGAYVGVNQTNLTTASVTVGDGGASQYFVTLDNGAVTSTVSTDFGGSNSGICIANLSQGSRACAR